MYKLKISGNFLLIIRNSDQKTHLRHPTGDVSYVEFNENTLNPLIRFKYIRRKLEPQLSKQLEFEFNDLLNDVGNVFASVADLKLFLDSSIGFNNGGDSGNGAGVGILTEIPLIFLNGYYGNMSAANTATTYTTIDNTIGAFAIILINAASQPVVTGATLLPGATFVVSTNMHLVIQYFGVTVQYYFLELS